MATEYQKTQHKQTQKVDGRPGESCGNSLDATARCSDLWRPISSRLSAETIMSFHYGEGNCSDETVSINVHSPLKTYDALTHLRRINMLM